MINLSSKDDREQLEELILTDVNNYCQSQYQSGHREHLGASIIGENCSRKLWYNFRWVKAPTFNGRMLRLFQVGHQAEPRFIKYLEGIGFKVWAINPQTNRQYSISSCNGHYGGSADGVCKPPERYGLETDLVFLNEFKTNGTGAGFNAVNEKELHTAKPMHFKQMCQYGYHFKLKYGLYIIENKNDSDLIIKIVPLDWTIGMELEKKAQDIISSQIPPPRIAENPAFFDCKYCEYAGICHENHPVEKNCRSCRYANPIQDAKWFCNKWNAEIPSKAIKAGCDAHMSINI